MIALRPHLLSVGSASSALLYAGVAGATALATSAVFAVEGAATAGHIVAEILRRFMWSGTVLAGLAAALAAVGFVRDADRGRGTLLGALLLVTAHSGWMIVRQRVIEAKAEVYHLTGVAGATPDSAVGADFQRWHAISVGVFLVAIAVALATAWLGLRAGVAKSEDR